MRVRGSDSSGDGKEGPRGNEGGFRVGISKGSVKRTIRRRSFTKRRRKEFKQGGLKEESSQLRPRRAEAVRRRLHGAGHDEKTLQIFGQGLHSCEDAGVGQRLRDRHGE